MARSRERGAIVVVGAAHAPGHIDVGGWDVDVAFATVHKWFPVPRSIGLFWCKPELGGLLHPAEPSLTYDAADPSERFAWPGTYDPAARLCLAEAIAVQQGWAQDGHCERLADYASETLTGLGAVATAGVEHLPPRMRAFLLPGVPVAELNGRLLGASIRAWTGSYRADVSVLRGATHVYTECDDIDLLERCRFWD